MIARHACLRTFVDTPTRRKVLRSCSAVPRGLQLDFVAVLGGVVAVASAYVPSRPPSTPEKKPCREAGHSRLSQNALCGRSPLGFRSGLLRLVAVVEGEQRLPSIAEMLDPEGVERMRPSRCQQR